MWGGRDEVVDSGDAGLGSWWWDEEVREIGMGMGDEKAKSVIKEGKKSVT